MQSLVFHSFHLDSVLQASGKHCGVLKSSDLGFVLEDCVSGSGVGNALCGGEGAERPREADQVFQVRGEGAGKATILINAK